MSHRRCTPPSRGLVSRACRVCLLAQVALLSGGCASRVERTLVPPAAVATLDSGSPWLKAHRADGGVYVLSEWAVDGDGSTVVGSGTLLDVNRTRVASGGFRLPADSVVLYETNVVEASGPRTALTVMVGVTALVAGLCAADPKACFGSCPTFYAADEDGELRLQAEGFSASIAPGLEATDVDMLLHAGPREREYALRLTNEALETHVIRSADLLAVPRPPGTRVYMTSDGRYLGARGAVAPSSCVGAEGDCLDAVVRADGTERYSLADSADLASRETVDLVFAEVPGGDVGLVLTTRQTLLTTFLVYQALAYLGADAGRWLARIEPGDPASRERVGAVGRVLGDVEVLLADGDGRWSRVGSVGETGPIATDTRVVPLPPGREGPVRVRLRMTKGMWRLDRAALVALGPEVRPVRLSPTSVTRDGEPAPGALAALHDPGRTLVTLPGDEYDLAYRLPPDPAGYELFLEATGYYLEWMRSEWLAERDPLRAVRLVTDPAALLRELAPAFKELEPRIENLFWNSRYVGR